MQDERFRILMVEDSEEDALLVQRALQKGGVDFEHERVMSASTFTAALERGPWDIVLSDYLIPGFGGLEALALLQTTQKELPFILVSGSVGEERAAEAVRLGARDYVLKDRLTRLPSAVMREIREARNRAKQGASELEAKQAKDRLENLKRFFPGGVAERIVSGNQVDPFAWHRKDVTVLFVDLHGFTGFVELSEPEVVVEILTEYYSRVAKAVLEFGGTVGHVAGDGVMVFFNDPVDIPNPQEMAVRTGLRIRDELSALQRKWADMDFSIDFGAGIASGFATVGGIGVEGCWDYSVIGTVTNVAFRLCAIAKNGEILVPRRLVQKISAVSEVVPHGSHELKGIHDPLTIFNVTNLKASGET